jgi:deoxyribonuclease V
VGVVEVNILAVDVDYRRDKAVAAGIVFQDWNAASAWQELTVRCQAVEAYVPGEFYRRELPCILKLLEQVEFPVDIIVIDGFVYLGEEHRPGLGGHLYESLDRQIAVVGVAKSAFKDTPASAALWRGGSQRPLYVTAIGIEENVARQGIQQMAGKDRLPTLLKRVDRLCRERD